MTAPFQINAKLRISCNFGGVWGEERRAHARMRATNDVHPGAIEFVGFFESIESLGFGFLPFPDPGDLALVAGVYLSNLFRWSKTDLRFEFGQFEDFVYKNKIYKDGLTFDGRIIGHHSGGDSRNLFLRLTRWLSENLYLGFDLQTITRGIKVETTNEKRYQLGLDLSYRGLKGISTFFRYQLEKIDNIDFNAGNSDTNHFLKLEATYQF